MERARLPLMVSDVDRTGLAIGTARDPHGLFTDLARLDGIPGHIKLLPDALGGFVCGRGLSGKAVSTLGSERRHNPTFHIGDADPTVRVQALEQPAVARGSSSTFRLAFGLHRMATVTDASDHIHPIAVCCGHFTLLTLRPSSSALSSVGSAALLTLAQEISGAPGAVPFLTSFMPSLGLA